MTTYNVHNLEELVTAHNTAHDGDIIRIVHDFTSATKVDPGILYPNLQETTSANHISSTMDNNDIITQHYNWDIMRQTLINMDTPLAKRIRAIIES